MIIFPVVLYVCETYPFRLREDYGLSVFRSRVLRKALEPKSDKITGW